MSEPNAEADAADYVPCVKCGAPSWVLQLALGQQVYTVWLCAEHIERCREDFGRWFAGWLGEDAPWHKGA